MMAAITDALALLAVPSTQLLSIISLSCTVSICAVMLGALAGLPLGAWLATAQFRGQALVIVLFNGLKGLPSVLVGVLVYLTLSRGGTLGAYG